jgi:hypothetical protein
MVEREIARRTPAMNGNKSTGKRIDAPLLGFIATI